MLKLFYSSDVKRGQNLEAEARVLRPSPRSRPELWGRGQFLRSRPKPRPKIKLWIKSSKCWLTTYRQIYIIMIETTQFISHSLSQLSSIIVWCPVVSKVKCKQIGPSISSWLLVLLLQTEARPRPNVRGRGQSFEAEAKILASRPLWPRGLKGQL